MASTELINKINESLAEEFEIEIEELRPEAELMKTLELDSLDLVDMVVLIEQNFGLTLKAQDFAEVKTFQDFYELIESRLNAAK